MRGLRKPALCHTSRVSGEPCRRGPCSHAAARSLRGALLCSQTWVVATSGQDLELIRTREGRDEVTGGEGGGKGWHGVVSVWAVVCAAITTGPRHSGNRGPMGKTQGTHGVIQSAGNFYGVFAQARQREGKNGPRRKGLPSHTHPQAAGDQLPRTTGQTPPGTSISLLWRHARGTVSADNITTPLSYTFHSPTFFHRCRKFSSAQRL